MDARYIFSVCASSRATCSHCQEPLGRGMVVFKKLEDGKQKQILCSLCVAIQVSQEGIVVRHQEPDPDPQPAPEQQ